MRKIRNISIIFKCIMVFTITIGILVSIGIIGGPFRLHMFYTFTNLSNIYILIITILTLYSLIRKENTGGVLYRGRILGLIIILLTGAVYHFILLPEKTLENPNYQVFTISNIITHYVTPSFMLFDWIVFDVKGKMKKNDPIIIILFPIIYFMACCVYGYCGLSIPNKESSYIYFFMDFDLLGILGVAKWCILILFSLTVLVYGVYYLDSYLGERQRI